MSAASAAEAGTGLRLALAGGGTGGHIVPGLHLLAHDSVRAEVLDLLWFQTGRPVEERVMEAARESLETLALERVCLALEPPGGGAPSLARLLRETLPATRVARRALARHRSQVLLGLGGFTTLPATLAAKSLGLPILLLEINAVPGRATRWLTPFARRVLHAWPEGTERSRKHVFVGPPLAPAFLAGPPTREERASARRAEGFDPDRGLLLVLGGSQGAQGLNRFVRAHALLWTGAGLQVLHQAGPRRSAEGADPHAGYQVREYVDDVPRALRAASTVLCRGGASTLAELAVAGLPMWVVPYPHHADRHQERNAALLGEGVRIVPESELAGESGAAAARELLDAARSAEREHAPALLRRVPRDGALALWAETVRAAGAGSD